MSLIQQIIAEINTLRRQVQDQMRLIDDFKRANQANITLVRDQLGGSQRGHDFMMVAALDRTESSLNRSAAALRLAETALLRVSTI